MALQDIDELFLKCRNEEARQLIKEAVACYKSGAYRASITMTWLALVFDYIEKLRLLKNHGDREASVQLEIWTKAYNTADTKISLRFERSILEEAKSKLHLISETEYIDLQRLYLDRCRCVHPSVNADEEMFAPSAELARVHLCNSVNYFLSLPPVQGPMAIDSIMKIIDSNYFPQSADQAEVALRATALSRARPNLIRSIVFRILKNMSEDQFIYPTFNRKMAALNAIGNLYHQDFQSSLKKYLSSMIRDAIDENIPKLLRIVASLKDCWDCIDKDALNKLENALKILPTEYFDTVETCIGVPALEAAAKFRIARATRAEIIESFFFIHPEAFSDRIIDLLITSTTFAQARELKDLVVFIAVDLSKEQVKKLIIESAKNGQVWHSTGFKEVIFALSKNKNIDYEEYKKLVQGQPTLTSFAEQME